MTLRHILAATALLAASTSAHAQVAIDTPWARATVPGQHATGMFMTLTAQSATRLVAARSAAAKSTEIHEMTNEDEIMKMREVDGVELPAGKAVELRPGGYHIMLMGLAAQVKEGTRLPLTLTFRNADGAETTVDLEVPVRALTAPAHAGHGRPSGH